MPEIVVSQFASNDRLLPSIYLKQVILIAANAYYLFIDLFFYIICLII